MANVLLQFGQSGGQVGANLLSSLSRDAPNNAYVNYWFSEADNEALVANALLVKTDSTQSPPPLGSVVFQNSVSTENSWTAGYTTVGPTLLDAVTLRLDQICERLDQVSGFLAIGSIGEGVDSAVGAYISQHLKDHFPRKLLTNFVGIPNSYERTSMQNYDSLFSLVKIHECSDAILLSPESNSFGKTSKCNKSGFDEVRAIAVAEQLTNVLQCDLGQNILKRFPMLALHLDLKLLNLQSSPNHIISTANSNSFTWQTILKCINDLLNSDFKPLDRATKSYGLFQRNADCTKKCVSLLFSARDSSKTNVLPLIEKKFNQQSIFPHWTIPDSRFQAFQRDGPFMSRNKICTVVANNTFFNCWLEELIEESWKQYNSRAYWHHFLSNGITDADFVEMYLTTEQILDSYKSLNELCVS